jgi:flagellar motility protein MotE (MotC chaperone)
MKKLFLVLVLTLALNFLGLAGGVGYLFQSGQLNKAKIKQIRDVVFAPPAPSPLSQPGPAPKQSGNFRNSLTALMSNQTGRSAVDQVEFLRRTFDAQMLELDQRQRQVSDLQTQVDLANQKLAVDRAALDKREKDLAAREQEAQRLQDDAGFQSSLALYSAMPVKQVKSIFMTLNEQTVQQYLQAMDTRTAGKIIKEFKSADETAFIQRVLERIRQSQVSSTDGK